MKRLKARGTDWKYLKPEYDVFLYTKKVYDEDFVDGVYCESNKNEKDKTFRCYQQIVRIKCGYELLDITDPYVNLFLSNFFGHIKPKHQNISEMKIIATIAEPDTITRIHFKSKNEKIFFIERMIEGETTRVVVRRNKQSILYVVTAYTVEDNIKKENEIQRKAHHKEVIYSNLVE